jgi:hypothetical protein
MNELDEKEARAPARMLWPALMSAVTAAEYYEVSVSTFRRRMAWRIPTVDIGLADARWARRDLDAFVDRCPRLTTPANDDNVAAANDDGDVAKSALAKWLRDRRKRPEG